MQFAEPVVIAVAGTSEVVADATGVVEFGAVGSETRWRYRSMDDPVRPYEQP